MNQAGVQTIMRFSDSAARNSGNTGTTLTADDTLLFAGSGDSQSVYMVETFLIISAANATMDFKYAWTIPAGVTGYHGPVSSVSNVGGWVSANTGTAVAALTTNFAASYGFGTMIGVSGAYNMALVFMGSTSGNITLTWAQNTSDAGDLKLLTGSFLRITKVVG